jgi:DNA mismatch repair protein MutL
LERIGTLGFRGEALASIAAVARVTLVTRRVRDLGATSVLVQHGNVSDVRETGAPAGTRIEVADLFGNTPARRKFLKTPATEVGHVTELVTRTALAWPHVGFTLLHGGRRLLELAAVREDEERVRQVFGEERSLAMMAFTGRNAAGYTCGWLSNSHLTFPSARQIYTYVNRRYVRDKLVTHALMAGYSTLLMHGRYPGAVVFLDINFDEVDVNVHPAKSEVRFRRGGAVHELLAHAVQARLRDQEGDRPTSVLKTPAPLFPGAGGSIGEGAARPLPPPLRLVERPLDSPVHPSEAPGPAASTLAGASPVSTSSSAGFFSSLRVIGQVFGGYLVCENANSMIVIDQHAAHERVMFERLRAAYGSGAVPRQQLLVPTIVDVGARAATLLSEQLDDLGQLGFEIEPYGGNSFAVRAVPALLGDADPSTVLRDLAEDLVEVGRSRRLDQAAEDVLARLACHSAVRIGQGLQPEQVRALLAGMDRVDFSGNCPHGRPAYLTFGRGELERWFKRT